MEIEKFILEAETRNRQTYIGGSDVAAILGLSKYKTALQVYTAKTEEVNEEDKFIFRAGKHNESFILDEYCNEYQIGDHIRDCNAYLIEKPYIGCQLDLFRREEDDRIRLADAKMVSINRFSQFGEAGTCDLPADILCQIALQRLVTKACRVDVPCMFYPQEIKTFTYYENLELEDAIFFAVNSFWNNHVVAKIPPDAQSAEDLKRLYPQDNGLTIDVEYKAVELAEEIKTYREAEAIAKKMKEEREIELKKIIGAHQSARYGSDIIATYKTSARKAYQVNESTTRTLRIL